VTKANNFHLIPINITVGFSLVISIRLSLTTTVDDLDAPTFPRHWLEVGEVPCNLDNKLSAYTVIEAGRIVICPIVINNYITTLAANRGLTGAGIDQTASTISVVLFHEFLHLLFDDVSKFSFYAYYIGWTNVWSQCSVK
jgi:hypothetical protein